MNPKNIRKELAKLNIVFNENAVLVLTKRHVPIYVKVIASFGESFNYCEPINSKSAVNAEVNAMISMDRILNHCDNYEDWFHAQRSFDVLKASMVESAGQNHSTKAQQYIILLATLTAKFCRQNPNILVVQADKGGKTVIMDREDYEARAVEHIEKNISLGNYVEVHADLLTELQPVIEDQYFKIVSEVSPFLIIDGDIKEPLRRESYLIPMFYGCPKIHKPDMPLRPIISSCNMIGDFLSKWLFSKLGVLTQHLSKYNVCSVLSVKKDLKSFKLEENHVLCSLDYESMFTNVDVDETIAIISDMYYLIEATTSVPLPTFLRCLRFYTKDAAYFVGLGRIFAQCKGLAMGNRLAHAMAEIPTNQALLRCLVAFDASIISFIYKHVDDIFSSIHRDYVTLVCDAISTTAKMTITVTNENEDWEVDYLDCTFRRNLDGTISSKWFKKSCSSLQTLNYHSYHFWSVKDSNARQMVKKALDMTTPDLLLPTESMLIEILRNSSYPSNYIEKLLGNYVKRPAPANSDQYRYISCPLYKPIIKGINSVISQRNLPVRIGPTPFWNNKRVILSRLKDACPYGSQKNSLFKVSCKCCDYSCELVSTSVDIRRTIKRSLHTDTSVLATHFQKFPHHELNDRPDAILTFRNQRDAFHSQKFFAGIMKNRQNNL